MSKVASPFSQSLNGFHFINRFEIKLPIKFQLPLAGTVDLNDVVFGLCGGMTFAALDYFYADQPIPDTADVKKIDPLLLTYLCGRQLDSLRMPVLVKIIEWMVLEDKEVAARCTRTEIPKLRRMLDKGEPVPLCLIRMQGLNNPTNNHQVLATGYDYNPATSCLSLSLYEPNYPGQDVSITVDMTRPGSGATFHQSTGELLRGFFVMPYKVEKSVPTPAAEQVVSFAAPTGLQLVWPVDTRIINQKFGENPENYRQFRLPGHEGLDLYAVTGANVYACADGEVYQSEHPKDHPYGVQIRIKHLADGKTYHTVYAHLSETRVKVGDRVTAGQLIGLADNTGNSFGSHLHLTLKIDGEGTPGYPAGIVDPLPYLQAYAAPTQTPPPDVTRDALPPEPLPSPSGITVYTTGQVNMRRQPNTDAEILTTLPAGDALSVLGDASAGKAKIGQEDQWLQVQAASGLAGYVAAWFVQDTKLDPFPPSGVIVYAFDTVNLRSGPGTVFNILASLSATDPLSILGDENTARARIGKENEWLQVQTQAGQRGFIAAWLVHLTGQVAPATDLVVYPTGTINVRARPDAAGNILTFATETDALTVLGDRATGQAKIGQQNQWINVRTPDKYIGYVAAWFVTTTKPAIPAPSTGTNPVVKPVTGNTLMVFPTADINLRAQASANSGRITGAFCNESLTVVETDLNSARAKIGQQDSWLYVQKSDGSRGWAAAWFLSEKK